MNTLSSRPPSRQKGYVLLMTLIMLVMLTVLALTEVTLNTGQTRVAGNATDAEISFEKAEGALNQGINSIINGTYPTASFLQNANGLYILNPNAAPLWTTVNWASASAVINSFQGGTGAQASYIIEQLPSVIQPGQNMNSPAQVYRITARSVGVSGNYAIMLQSTLQIQQ
ncbi:MAG: PilX N-terminal domain-containing pilus assembly protein [Legionellales bacterium]